MPQIAQAVKDIYQAVSIDEAKRRIKETVTQYEGKAKKFCDWLEENIEEGLTFYSFSRKLWKKIRTVNMVESLNKEVRRRTNVVRVFPNEGSCLRLITAVLMDKHEDWVSSKVYLRDEET